MHQQVLRESGRHRLAYQQQRGEIGGSKLL
jgi:hypothetical protein